jgi:hypothetical protein
MDLEALVKACEGHTPGSWQVDGCGAIFGPDGAPIMTCGEFAALHGKGSPESYANALLIRAAPDLLALATSQEAELADYVEGTAGMRDAISSLRAERDALEAGAAEYDKTHAGVVNGYLDRIAELKRQLEQAQASERARIGETLKVWVLSETDPEVTVEGLLEKITEVCGRDHD